MAKNPAPVKILSYPVKLDNPVISFINYMIFQNTAQINRLNHSLRQIQERALDDTPFVMRNLEIYLTSQESGKSFDGVYKSQWFERISKMSDQIVFHEDQIGELTRMKLHLLGDVDFRSGRNIVSAINEIHREGLERIANIKAERLKRRKVSRERQRKSKRLQEALFSVRTGS